MGKLAPQRLLHGSVQRCQSAWSVVQQCERPNKQPAPPAADTTDVDIPHDVSIVGSGIPVFNVVDFVAVFTVVILAVVLQHNVEKQWWIVVNDPVVICSMELTRRYLHHKTDARSFGYVLVCAGVLICWFVESDLNV